MKPLGSKSKTKWQRVCEACSRPLDKTAAECPNCGTPVVDIEGLLAAAADPDSPEHKRLKKKYTRAAIIDQYCTFFLFFVLMCSMLGSILTAFANDRSRGIDIWLDDMFGISSSFGLLCTVYVVLASVAFFALLRISGTNARFHFRRLSI